MFISSLPPADDILLIGDMNARTKSLTPHIHLPDTQSTCLSANGPGREDSIEIRIQRESEDTVANPNGHDLVALCSTTGLLMLNGLRNVGDMSFDSKAFHKHFTFDPCNRNCLSVCDYCCVPLRTLPLVSRFIVGDHNGLSDHHPIITILHPSPHATSSQTESHSDPPPTTSHPGRWPREKDIGDMSVVDDILCNNSHFMNSLDVLYNMFCHETSMPNTNDVLNECYDTCMAGLAESVMALCQPTSCRCSDSGQAPGRKHTREK